MTRYETLILTTPDFTNDEFAQLEAAVQKTTQEAHGSLISFERWGKYHLAYPVRKNEYGVYCLVRVEAHPEHKQTLLKALNDLFTLKFAESIMRTMTVHLDPRTSLAYHRPESLEEAPVRDVDTFLKDNKMEGLRGGRRPVNRVEEDEDEISDIESRETHKHFSSEYAVTAKQTSEA